MMESSIAVGAVGVVVLAVASVALGACSRTGDSQKDSPKETQKESQIDSSTTVEAKDGRAIFTERCAGCHGQEGQGGRGPMLRGLAGRKAGVARFGYSRALRTSTL